MAYLYYINTSGKDIAFTYQGQKYIVKAWKHIDLPEEMYDFIEIQQIPLELNYQRYIEEG